MSAICGLKSKEGSMWSKLEHMRAMSGLNQMRAKCSLNQIGAICGLYQTRY